MLSIIPFRLYFKKSEFIFLFNKVISSGKKQWFLNQSNPYLAKLNLLFILIGTKGILKYNDGSKYVGEFEDGKCNGQGILTSQNSTYEGEWMDGQKHRQGKLILSDWETLITV